MKVVIVFFTSKRWFKFCSQEIRLISCDSLTFLQVVPYPELRFQTSAIASKEEMVGALVYLAK